MTDRIETKAEVPQIRPEILWHAVNRIDEQDLFDALVALEGSDASEPAKGAAYRASGLIRLLHEFQGHARPYRTEERPSTFTCPTCGMTSHHPKDVEHRYCGNCHKSIELPYQPEGER